MLISCRTEDSRSQKNILRFNSQTGITSLDPAYARTQENIRTVNQLFNGLLQLDSDLNVVPSLAKSWSISEDSKTYTFVIRKGVLFHNDPIFNGIQRTVTAQDFVYSLQRIIDPEVASDGAWIFNGIIADQNPFSAPNDSTFQIRLTKPYTPLLSMLTMAYCSVVPKEAVSHYGKNFGIHPVGTGIFKYANWASGIKLNLLKNSEYWEDTKTNIDAISISFIQSKQTELLEFTQGNLDLFTGLESSFKDEILTAKGLLKEKYTEGFKLIKTPFLNTEYLAFNMEDESSPVSNLNFRKAIHHCIDRVAMIQYLKNGVGKPADGGFSPKGLPAYRMAEENYFDPKLAKEYLAKSGISQSKPLILTTTSNYLDLCILVQKNCAEIDIEIKIDVVPSSLLKQQKSAGDLTFFRSSWIADYPDGENYMACFYSPNKAPNGPNYTRLNSKLFDAAYEKLLSAAEASERSILFSTLEEELFAQQPFVLLFYDESIWIRSKKIDGICINALNHLDLRNTIMR
jgi:peptide/nickel transport system substrate-binding protein